MKNYIKLISFVVFLFCYHSFVYAQNVPADDVEAAKRDAAESILQAKAAEFNFTASWEAKIERLFFI